MENKIYKLAKTLLITLTLATSTQAHPKMEQKAYEEAFIAFMDVYSVDKCVREASRSEGGSGNMPRNLWPSAAHLDKPWVVTGEEFDRLNLSFGGHESPALKLKLSTCLTQLKYQTPQIGMITDDFRDDFRK